MRVLPIEDKPLSEADPELFKILKEEKRRQFESIELIGSENYPSKMIFECLSSCAHNKSAEGEVGNKFYGMKFNIDI